ncbi:unnamed protein product [Schistosoma turkestanicum]|nr:unnamed protein product [Schistosoma turkestanicum]
MEPNNRESAAFIVAYFSILTGLPAKFTRKAVMKCREKLDITSEYDSIIESMQNSATAKQLRDDLFRDTSGYTEDKLIEDLRRIYQLAELDAPTSSEIQLETRRDSMKLESSTTQNNSLNQLFRRLSTDTNKQDVTGSGSSSSSSNQRDYKTPDIIIQDDDDDRNKKQDLVSSPSSTSPQHPHHDHSNSPFTTNQPDKIDNRVGNDTNQTQSIDNAHNTDLNSAHNKMHSSSNIDHQHHHHDSMQKSKFSKVTITYAPSRESVESDAVDEYLRSTSAEERDKVRKRVAITHAHVKKTDDDNDYL